MKGLDYINENKLVVRFGEKKQEPVHVQQKPVFHQEKEVKKEAEEEVTIDEIPDEQPSRPHKTFINRISKLWDDIIDATDEKLDDKTSNN